LPRSSAVGSTSCRRVFDYPQHLARFEEVEEAQNDPDFWKEGLSAIEDMVVKAEKLAEKKKKKS